jgi:hypothetical protein
MLAGCKSLSKLTISAALIVGTLGATLPGLDFAGPRAAASSPLKRAEHKLDKARKKSRNAVKKAAKAAAAVAVSAGKTAVVGGIGALGVVGCLYANSEDPSTSDTGSTRVGQPSIPSHPGAPRIASHAPPTGSSRVFVSPKR